MTHFELIVERGHGCNLDSSLPEWTVRDDTERALLAVGGISVEVEKLSKNVRVELPFAGADQLYYRRDPTQICISNDPRKLYRRHMEVDERGLYSLLQFGSIAPPLSLWRDVRRFTPGRCFCITSSDLNVVEREATDLWSDGDRTGPQPSESLQQRSLTDAIDEVLIRMCPDENPVILFSGGVDSGVLAARAAAMDWSGTTLANYSMEENDPESELAESMAKHFGMQLLRIRHDLDEALGLLDRVAELYRHPFGDDASLPTYRLCEAVVESVPRSRVILDGIGADGAFGISGRAPRWRKLYRVPRWARRAAGHAYKAGRYWNRNSRAEYPLRVLRRAGQMPLLCASVAQNPLLNVAYHFESETYREVHELLGRWMDQTLPSDDDRVRLSGIDVAMYCGDIYAQRSKSIFDAHAQPIAYPFIDRSVVRLALEQAVYWPGSEQPKRVLKSILARHVPQQMVYRPKSGFVAPAVELFSHPRFLDAFDRLLRPASALANVLDRSRMRELRGVIASANPLPMQMYNFVWAAVFTNLWIEQLKHSADLWSEERAAPGGERALAREGERSTVPRARSS